MTLLFKEVDSTHFTPSFHQCSHQGSHLCFKVFKAQATLVTEKSKKVCEVTENKTKDLSLSGPRTTTQNQDRTSSSS
jgi:hypothetical protein